jgi:tRNA (pseudouridine54-N1)-methyltransferase
MIRFAAIGHLAPTSGDFSLNDLPGGAGRMDILCRCVTASLFLSHGMRRDAEIYLVLCGQPDPPATILFSGEKVRYLNPDERSAASLIKKALAMHRVHTFRESTPGVFVRKGGLTELLAEHRFAVLDESGQDVRNADLLPGNYIVSDHLNLSPGELEMVSDLPRLSIGPLSLHADSAITIVLNESDRRAAGWT